MLPNSSKYILNVSFIVGFQKRRILVCIKPQEQVHIAKLGSTGPWAKEKVSECVEHKSGLRHGLVADFCEKGNENFRSI